MKRHNFYFLKCLRSCQIMFTHYCIKLLYTSLHTTITKYLTNHGDVPFVATVARSIVEFFFFLVLSSLYIHFLLNQSSWLTHHSFNEVAFLVVSIVTSKERYLWPYCEQFFFLLRTGRDMVSKQFLTEVMIRNSIWMTS